MSLSEDSLQKNKCLYICLWFVLAAPLKYDVYMYVNVTIITKYFDRFFIVKFIEQNVCQRHHVSRRFNTLLWYTVIVVMGFEKSLKVFSRLYDNRKDKIYEFVRLLIWEHTNNNI